MISNNNLVCQYCSHTNIEGQRYCAICGKLIYIRLDYPLQSIIATDQVLWLLFGGFSSYFILRYLVFYINTSISFIFLISTLTSFVMINRLLILTKRFKVNLISDFFKNYKQFFLLTGLLIWLIESLLYLSLGINNSTLIENVLLYDILPFTVEFIQGYSFGLIVPLFFHIFNKKRYIR